MAQRIVLVVALGVSFGILGEYVVSLGDHFSGWTAYAPLSAPIPSVPHVGLAPWLRVIVWIGLSAVWAAMSVWLLRTRKSGD